MKLYLSRLPLSFLAEILVAGTLVAQGSTVPNWTVPPYRGQSASGGLSTMTDVTVAVSFVGVAPCRLVDTRQAGFPAGYGPPALTAGSARTFDLNSDPQCSGIPSPVAGSGSIAYSLNITVTNTQGPGFLKIYPQGGSVPFDVSTLNYVAGQTIANAAIVPAGTNGGVTVIAGVSGTDLIIDINGYFSSELGNPANNFILNDNSGAATMQIRNHSGSCSFSCGLLAITDSNLSGAAVEGDARLAGNNSAGVLGKQGGLFTSIPSYSGAGVRGESHSLGMLGISTSLGVAGSLLNSSGGVLTEGYLAFDSGSATKYGVWAATNYGGGGAKFFVEPHPTDASKVIRYISLEGNEPGTYFRGRGRFERGMARIAVPEDFRMVTDEEGLTVQVTPIGAMATVGVIRMNLQEIVVQSSRNVEFSYLVQGIRRTHKHLTSPIGEGREYMPRSADATMPLYLTDGQKQLLIQNGTYKPDGTVNMETAQRLGWDRIWEERSRPAPQPAQP
jgi:hypothetical protein